MGGLPVTGDFGGARAWGSHPQGEGKALPEPGQEGLAKKFPSETPGAEKSKQI